MADLIGKPKVGGPSAAPRLPRGVTGFDRPDPSRQTSERDFKAVCHLVARRCGGTVVHLAHCQQRIACNYLAVTIERRPGRTSILANCYHPLVAFVAEGAYDRMDPEFIGDCLLADAFRQLSRFQPLDLEFLTLPIDADVVADLGPNELKQLKYWMRGISHFQHVGQIIFNTWD